MRLILAVVVCSLVGCTSSAPPPGPQGEPGATGPQGIQGPTGPQGPAGTSAVTVQQADGGVQCPTGGVMLKDMDGGVAFVCNGAQGPQGQQGIQGQQGVQGPVGPMPTTLMLYTTDGGELGNPIPYPGNSNEFDFVFIKDTKCVSQVVWDSADGGYIPGIQASVSFDGPNCTGRTFVMASNSFWPAGCYFDSGITYRAKKPMNIGTMTAQSRLYTASNGTSCITWTESGRAVEVERVTLPILSQAPTF